MASTNSSIRRRSGRPWALIVASKVLGVISLDSLVGIFLAGALFLTLKGALTGVGDGSRSRLQDTTATGRHVAQSERQGASRNAESVVTVAYAVSVTGCGSDPVTEGGAVLQHSIHRVSSRGSMGGRYDYAMFAIYHPDAEACALPLQELGYTLLKRDTPVAVSDIEGEFLRSKIEMNGCCGEKELIKLEAYTLIDYPIVVHLDLDVLMLKPLDSLFDLMLGRPVDAAVQAKIFMWKDKQPAIRTIDAFFTMDYNMVPPSVEYKPVQGGFFVTRPSMEVYEEYRNIIRKGDFQEGKGWGGKVGPFHGSMTFQGIIPYYYNVLHKGTSIELNRCIFNQMCDNPRTGRTVNDVVSGACRTGEKECEDCRATELDQVVTTHFTLCQKPWWCLPHDQNAIQHRLCRKLTHEWFAIRSELEISWGRQGRGPGTFADEIFHGYCKMQGKHGYTPIEPPYGGKT